MSHKNLKRFSFTWKIANFLYCFQRNGDEIVSPSFVAECLGGSLWYLELYPKGFDEESKDFLSCYLVRDGDCSFTGKIAVDYMLQIIDNKGEILESTHTKSEEFDKGQSDGCKKLVELNKIVDKLKEQNEGTLIIRCIISLGIDMKMTTACVVHSQINSVGYSFKWSIDNFNLHEQERVFHLGKYKFKITLGWHSLSNACNLAINISLLECTYGMPCFVVCQISFLNCEGPPEPAFYGTHIFQFGDEKWTLPSSITTEQLKNSESIYLTDKIFMMLFKFSCSYDVVSETTPSYTYATSEDVNSLSVLQSNFRELFVSKKHTDVVFRNGNQELPVHKTILIARSPVFATMFDQNMIENQTGIVDIIDVDLETLKSFLEYLYTGTVEKLDYDNAIKLVIVAEKYQVQSLIEECCAFLLTVLSKKNVCELIYVADLINHKHLKKAAMNYVANHIKEILVSPEWSKWSEKNLKLTSEIFLHIASNCDITLKKSESELTA